MFVNRAKHFLRASCQDLIAPLVVRWRPPRRFSLVVRPQRDHPNRESQKVSRILNDSKCRVETSAHKKPESQGKYACADINSKAQNHSFDVLANPDAVISGEVNNRHQYNSLGYSQISF